MMAPHFERARLLSIAIDRATGILQEPITKVEVTDDKVICSAGSRTISMTYGYGEAVGQDGHAAPSSGSWWVQVDEERARDPTRVAWALGKATGRWLRGS